MSPLTINTGRPGLCSAHVGFGGSGANQLTLKSEGNHVLRVGVQHDEFTSQRTDIRVKQKPSNKTSRQTGSCMCAVALSIEGFN
ncbi:proline rich antigen 2 [Plakobranchus ocellatus]|uniref:Proline rich antigen 2 n=1 Tax=Plakobranchus ocellatus TaxID=259542 RepID=A0AAV3YNK7_9GAST|nr:proline rich antigen 2 [Plakobranchus ocellatus]